MLIYENKPSEMKFPIQVLRIIYVSRIFFLKFGFKKRKEINLRIITDSYVTNSEKGFQQNRLYSCSDSRVRSESVGVNASYH